MASPTAPHILPTDATQTKAWRALAEHYASLKDTKATLKNWFAEDLSVSRILRLSLISS